MPPITANRCFVKRDEEWCDIDILTRANWNQVIACSTSSKLPGEKNLQAAEVFSFIRLAGFVNEPGTLGDRLDSGVGF